jgi:regulator of sigma E protease
MNLLGAFLILTAAYMTGVPQREFVRIEQVIASSAAEEAGLQVGDVITAVAGVQVEEGAEQIRERIHASAEQPLALVVVRAGQQLTITVTPRLVDGSGYLGIGMNWWPDLSSLKRYSLPDAAATAGSEMVNDVLSIFRLPRMVSTGEVSPSDVRPTGAAGILQLLAVFFKQSLEWGYPFPILQTTALISLAVGLTNLLPLPALDGGRLLFITIEAVRGRRLNPMFEARVHAAGMALLLVLSVILVAQDITNPLIPWSLLRR